MFSCSFNLVAMEQNQVLTNSFNIKIISSINNTLYSMMYLVDNIDKATKVYQLIDLINYTN